MVYRVIQWATGECGKEAVKAIAGAENLELVGARVFNPEKVGRDIGEVCGTDHIGLSATDDEKALLSIEADCVLWMAEASMFSLDAEIDAGTDELCRILRSGKNVISIVHTHLIHPPTTPKHIGDAIQAACEEGGVSFLATGIDPGFTLEILGLVCSGLCRNIENLKAMEILNYGPHMNRQIIFDVMGFGRPPKKSTQDKFLEMMLYAYKPSIALTAEAMGASIERIEPYMELHQATHDFDVASGTIRNGTVSAMKFGFNAYINGYPRLTVEHTTRMHPDEAPDWPTGHGYYIDIAGDPPIKLELLLGKQGDQSPNYYQDYQHVAVPMRAVHYIPSVCEAAPGMRSMLELPLPRGIGVFQ